MLNVLIIIFREGFEAFLTVAIILAYLRDSHVARRPAHEARYGAPSRGGLLARLAPHRHPGRVRLHRADDHEGRHGSRAHADSDPLPERPPGRRHPRRAGRGPDVVGLGPLWAP